jgi:membrane associated rhomboid family serine protease
MLIPIGDEPNEDHFPWMNYALIAVNVLVFLLVQRAGQGEANDRVVERYAYVPASPTLTSSFSSMFLHGGWMHLIGNMLFLWIFGDNVEARLGSFGYLLAYLATGLVGNLVHGFSDPTSAIPSLGASGAISGVEGLYVVAFPRNRVKVLLLFYYVGVFFIRAPWVIGFWFVWNDLLPYVLGDATAGDVAHGAHIGGLLSGVALCFALRPFFRSTPPVTVPAGPRFQRPRPANRAPWTLTDPYGGGRTSQRFPSSATGSVGSLAADESDVLGLWRAGKRETAADGFAALLQSGTVPSIPEPDFLRLSLWLEENRRYDDARRAFEAFLHSYPSSRSGPLAHFGLGMIYARHSLDVAAALPHLVTASRFSSDAVVREAAERELVRLGGA